MATITSLKVLTQDVIIRDHHYYLVRLNITGVENSEYIASVMYGTIEHDDVDESGQLKRQFNLLTLEAGLTIAEALERRRTYFEAMDLIQKLGL